MSASNNNADSNADDQNGNDQNTDDQNQNQDQNGGGDDGAGDKNTDKSSDLIRAELLKHKRENEELKKKIAANEKQKLEASGNWKELWEASEVRAKELEDKLDRNTFAFVTAKKRDAVKDAMLKAGMRTDALKILDKDDFDFVEVEVEGSGFKIQGVDLAVQKYRTEYPFMFSKDPGKVNSGGAGSNNGGGGDTTMTPAKVYAIERKFGVKSEEYQGAMRKLLEQKRNSLATR